MNKKSTDFDPGSNAEVGDIDEQNQNYAMGRVAKVLTSIAGTLLAFFAAVFICVMAGGMAVEGIICALKVKENLAKDPIDFYNAAGNALECVWAAGAFLLYLRIAVLLWERGFGWCFPTCNFPRRRHALEAREVDLTPLVTV